MESKVQTFCLVILTLIATSFALDWLEPVMIPFVLAIFLSLALSAMVDFQMTRFRIPQRVAVVLTVVLALLGSAAVAILISASVRQITANADSYQQQFTELVSSVTDVIPSEVGTFSLDRETLLSPLTDIPLGTVGRLLAQTANAVLALMSRSLLVLVFVLYLVLGSRNRAPVGVWAEIESQIKRYITAKAIISAATGVAVSLILFACGVDLALAFGLFAFLLNFIPSVGSIIATLLPLPVVLFSPELSPLASVLAIALPAILQLVMGNFIEPRIMGESLDLHPITILMSLIFWGMLWGVVGMLLATPIMAVAKILLEKLELTAPIAGLLAGRLRTEDGEAAD